MSMKKIIASVAAAALTVGSLAVVASAEDDVRVFNFVGTEGTMTINYTMSRSFLGGVDKYDLFGSNNDSGVVSADGESVTYRFYHQVKGFDRNTYNTNKNYLKELNDKIFSDVHLSDWWDTKVTITGVNERGNTVTAETKTGQDGWNSDWSDRSCEMFRVRLGDDGNPALQDYDLDLTRFDAVTKITISTTLPIDTEKYYIAQGAIKMSVGLKSYDTTGFHQYAQNQSQFTIGGHNFDVGDASYTTSKAENDGRVLAVGSGSQVGSYIWTFEGDYLEPQKNIGANADGSGVDGFGIGGNVLRWVNDNIVQQKGAKLRITFMKPKELADAITAGGITSYPTLPNTSAGSTILTPGQSGTSVQQDITIGVNLRNTTKLQQTTNVVDYVAEFDWDTLVQNSASTVSGNVDSIAFRVNENSKNLKDNIFAYDTDGKTAFGKGAQVFGIKTIEIVIPEQASVENDPARIITAGSADTFVKLIGTEKTIYGNGATEVAVENNITNNNVSYSLKLTDANGAYVQPAGEVTLQLSIPTDFRGLTLSSDKVRHTCNDGTVEELAIQNMETYKTDNYIVVKTSKFSSFDFSFEGAETTTEAPETTTEAPETTTEAPETTTEAAPTTDAGNTNNSGAASDKNANTGVVLAVVPAAVAAAGVIISKKRK